MIDNPHEYEVMAAVEARHWWYRTLHALVQTAISQYRNGEPLAILDAGCGTGGLLTYLVAQGYQDAQGFDLSPLAVQICRQQGLRVEQGDLADHLLHYEPESFDVIISNDTLYHVAAGQRVEFLKQACGRLRPGGVLIMNLPALAAFRGQHDRAVGVTHRFSRDEFRAMVSQTALLTRSLRYWPVVLSPIIWSVRTWQRQRDRVANPALPRSDLHVQDGWTGRLINETLFRLLQIERRCCSAGIVGSSLFAVLQRPEQPGSL